MALGKASHSALERPVMAITSELLYGDMVIDTGTERQQGLVSSHDPMMLTCMMLTQQCCHGHPCYQHPVLHQHHCPTDSSLSLSQTNGVTALPRLFSSS